uniref:Uncharacterized protein n=1 Tax=Romanomermis culicivorax TaxID=13658 RepID=A0A915IFQ3_ROMCU
MECCCNSYIPGHVLYGSPAPMVGPPVVAPPLFYSPAAPMIIAPGPFHPGPECFGKIANEKIFLATEGKRNVFTVTHVRLHEDFIGAKTPEAMRATSAPAPMLIPPPNSPPPPMSNNPKLTTVLLSVFAAVWGIVSA